MKGSRGLSPDAWRRANRLFGEWLERSPEERGSWVSALDLPTEVEEAFASLRTADALEEGPLDRDPEVEALGPEPGPEGSAEELAGLRVGRWILGDEIGRGGSALVFRARSADADVGHEVALKLLTLGALGRTGSAEFRHEQRILARLRHPHVATLIDGGVTADGTPYLVTELVEGLRLDDWCRENRVGLSGRLDLFRQVCAAVAHAHRHLVVHRDLKPANILVEGDGRSRLVDFGIAKVLEGADATRSVRALTPAYAAPEQFAGEPATTATDVFGLGLVLRDLLEEDAGEGRGGTPYPGSGAATTALLRRPLPGVDRDLVAIVEKALRAEAGDRYADARSLGDDLDRWRSGQPVVARGPGRVYRLRKFVRRNRWSVAFSAAAVVSLILFSLAMATERRESERARREAELTAAFLRDLFEVSAPERARGRTITARELLDRGAQRIRDELAMDPRARARLMLTIGDVDRELGLYDEAAPLVEEAVRILEAEEGATSPGVRQGLVIQGKLARLRGRPDEAEPLLRRALELREEASPDAEQAEILAELGILAKNRGRYEDAETLYRQALAIREEVLGAGHPDVARSLNNLAVLYRNQGRPAEAEALYLRSLAIKEAVLGPEAPSVASSLNNLAVLYMSQRRFAEAEPLYRRALGIWERTLGPEHPDVALPTSNLGLVYWQQGDSARAEPLLLRALQLWEGSVDPDHLLLAWPLFGLGGVARDLGRPEEAERYFLRALEIRTRALPPDHADIASVRFEYAKLLRSTGRVAEAEALESAMASSSRPVD